MEIKGLYGFVLTIILVGMVLGVGVLIFDTFNTSVGTLTTVTNQSFTVPANGSGTVTLRSNMVSFTSVVNDTADEWDSSNYTVDLTTGVLTNLYNETCAPTKTCYATFSYRPTDSATSGVMNSSISTVTPIASTWLPLIVTVAILAIILTLVIQSFGARRE